MNRNLDTIKFQQQPKNKSFKIPLADFTIKMFFQTKLNVKKIIVERKEIARFSLSHWGTTHFNNILNEKKSSERCATAKKSNRLYSNQMLSKRCALDKLREHTEYKSGRRRSFNPTIEDPYEDSEIILFFFVNFFQLFSYTFILSSCMLYHTHPPQYTWLIYFSV